MLKRLTHGLGAVAIVAATSFTMVYEAGPAQADVVEEATLLLKAAAGGGVGLAAASPEVEAAAGAVCATGVGCAVMAGAVVGIGLYMTKDTWMPWIANAFGAGTTQPVATCGPYGCVLLQSVISRDAVTASGQFQITGTGVFQRPWILQCKNTTTGATWQTSPSGGAFTGYAGNSYPWSFTLCAQYPNIQGVSPGTWITTYFEGGQTVNLGHVTWGTYNAYTGSGFDPNSAGVRNEVLCRNPDGSSYSVVGPGVVVNGLVEMPTCVGATGSQVGAHGECVTLSTQAPGTTPWVPQSSNCAAAGAAARSAEVKYPNCVGGTVACTYVVRVNGIPCQIGMTGCSDWPAQAETNPAVYGCYYGMYAVSLASCGLLERAYEPINGTTPLRVTVLNTDGDPRTYTTPTPVIAPPTTARVPAPTTTPTDTAVPGGASTVAPTGGQDCFPSGYGVFNPASWVLQPIKCALTWAFVPSSSFINGWGDSINAEWTGSPFGTWMNTIGGFGGIPIVNAGCAGPAVSTGFLGSGSGSGAGHRGAVLPAEIHPFDACSEPMATVAATSNLILSAGIAFYGGMKVVRQLGWAFGFKIDIGSERGTFT